MIRPILKYIPMGNVDTPVEPVQPLVKLAPYGFYWLLDNPNNGPQAMADVRANLTNPKVDGFRLRVQWKDIQPDGDPSVNTGNPPPYNWSILDNIKILLPSSKRVGISISAGIVCPDWVFNLAPKVYKFGLDASTPPSGDAAGNPPYFMPLPWDTNYQSRIRNFINAFAARYDNDPQVAYIILTGIQQLATLNFVENSKASQYVTDAALTNVTFGGFPFTKFDSATAAFLSDGAPAVRHLIVSDGNVNLLPNTIVVTTADTPAAPADPTNTTVYLNKATIAGDVTGATVLVEEWHAGQGDDHKVNELAKLHPVGQPGAWAPYADDPTGYASSAAYLDGAKKIADMFFTAFTKTPVLISPPPNIFPQTNPYSQDDGNNIRHYVENHSPLGHGGTDYTNLQARVPPYDPRVVIPNQTIVKQAIHPSSQTNQLYVNPPPNPFPGQPRQCQDLIEAGYTLGAQALELYKFDLTDPSVDAMVKAERRKFVPAGIP